MRDEGALFVFDTPVICFRSFLKVEDNHRLEDIPNSPRTVLVCRNPEVVRADLHDLQCTLAVEVVGVVDPLAELRIELDPLTPDVRLAPIRLHVVGILQQEQLVVPPVQLVVTTEEMEQTAFFVRGHVNDVSVRGGWLLARSMNLRPDHIVQ